MKFPNGSFSPFLSHDDWIKKNLKKPTPLSHLPSIPEFYANKEIFVTGFSGFIGKVLIEKLLRSCPKIKAIYVLLRAKKGQTIEERLKTLTKQVVFDLLRKENPNFAEKIIPIEGDVMELNLGISNKNFEKIKNVSIVFHSAASIRFDDNLKFAVLTNTRGTREVMRLAEKMKNIKVVMHVSTTYSNVYLETVEEKIYPPLVDWEKTIKICEESDQNQVDILTHHYINFMPNTYVFSKNLAEHCSYSFHDQLPIIIFRPSIVVSSHVEPFAGYVDNFNGPMGILLASAVGITKTMYCDEKNVLDCLPVDVCVKAMIVSAWKRAHEIDNTPPVMNAACANQFKVTIKQFLDMGIHGICEEFPMGKKMVFLPFGGVTLCKTWNFIRLIFMQLSLAVLVDAILKVKGKRPRIMKLQRKIYEANKALGHFVTHNWNFKNESFINLCTYLKPEDVSSFDYRPFFTTDVINFGRYVCYGFRRYLLKLKDEDLEKDRKNVKLMLFAVTIFKCLGAFIIFGLIFFKYNGNYFFQ
ncbi:hypothetical protein PVAND_004855 [Polypedilum vanderplanki]|uniref:Fatty acyl-CoA reductase n=1 Tax=Polypedilum vanderplanki TaxID=319348 RepID=A0A9J6C0B0_POLVA|nr:hypothetical protein PVAND_004855 [Polypedilum vanderplanki]